MGSATPFTHMITRMDKVFPLPGPHGLWLWAEGFWGYQLQSPAALAAYHAAIGYRGYQIAIAVPVHQEITLSFEGPGDLMIDPRVAADAAEVFPLGPTDTWRGFVPPLNAPPRTRQQNEALDPLTVGYAFTLTLTPFQSLQALPVLVTYQGTSFAEHCLCHVLLLTPSDGLVSAPTMIVHAQR